MGGERERGVGGRGGGGGGRTQMLKRGCMCRVSYRVEICGMVVRGEGVQG